MTEPNEQPSQPPNTPEIKPVTSDRLVDYMHAHGYLPLRGDDGEVLINFATGYLLFRVTKKESGRGIPGNERKAYVALTVLGRWRTYAPRTARVHMLEICNAWNRAALWHKTYAYEDDNHRLWMYCEQAIDVTDGLNNDRLNTLLDRAIGTGTGFFEMLEGTFLDTRFSTPA